MNRDVLHHITDDNVVYPKSSLPNTKFILFRDRHNRYWQLIPVTNPNVMMPFLFKPLTEEKFNELSTQNS